MTTLREFSSPGKLVTFFGDWHGNLPFAVKSVERVATEDNSRFYIHVGDFGFLEREK